MNPSSLNLPEVEIDGLIEPWALSRRRRVSSSVEDPIELFLREVHAGMVRALSELTAGWAANDSPRVYTALHAIPSVARRLSVNPCWHVNHELIIALHGDRHWSFHQDLKPFGNELDRADANCRTLIWRLERVLAAFALRAHETNLATP